MDKCLETKASQIYLTPFRDCSDGAEQDTMDGRRGPDQCHNIEVLYT